MRTIRFAETVRQLREEAGYTQLQVAEYLGIRQQSYCDYENGDARPNIEKLKKLAVLYHVSLEFLIGVSDW